MEQVKKGVASFSFVDPFCFPVLLLFDFNHFSWLWAIQLLSALRVQTDSGFYCR